MIFYSQPVKCQTCVVAMLETDCSRVSNVEHVCMQPKLCTNYLMHKAHLLVCQTVVCTVWHLWPTSDNAASFVDDFAVDASAVDASALIGRHKHCNQSVTVVNTFACQMCQYKLINAVAGGAAWNATKSMAASVSALYLLWCTMCSKQICNVYM